MAETRTVLVDWAKRRFGKLPPEPFVDLVLSSTPDADFPVHKAAIEALARRFGFTKRDDLVVTSRPRGSGLGRYRVGRKGRANKRGEYHVELVSFRPLVASCDCADFVRSSLGLCKHGLAVLSALGPRALSREAHSRRGHRKKPRLRWDPVHPLEGSADRLVRLWWEGSEGRPALRVKGKTTPAQRLSLIERQLLSLHRKECSAEPGARRVLVEEAERARRMASNDRTEKRALGALSSLDRELYDYQREGVRRFLKTGRLLLADDMGLGKTTQAIACCHALYRTRHARRGLAVVPASLKPQWKREWEATTRVPLIEMAGSPKERAELYRSTERGFLLLGYEQLLRDFPEVQAFDPEFVLLDEAQRIKNWATKSAAYVKALDAPYRLVLTGTPMENRFDELASIMDFVDSVALEPKWRLVPWHSISTGDGGQGRGGARHLDTLRKRMESVFLRRRRKEVLSQLPGRTDTHVPVEMTDAQSEEHEALRQPIAAIVQQAQRRPLTQREFLKLMQLLTKQRMICNGLAQVEFDMEWQRCRAQQLPSERFLKTLFAPKLFAFRDLVEQLVVFQERKIVVFSQWRSMLRLAEWSIRDVLKERERKSLFFTGAESSKQRERAIVDFHDDPSASVLFLSDAGGVGLNLQRAANCCINLELPWNPAVLEQRIARIYRLGQKQPIDVFNLVTTAGIESRIADLVSRKQAVFSTLFDGTSNEVHFEGEGSFLDGVKKLVEPVEVPQALTENDSQEDLSITYAPGSEPTSNVETHPARDDAKPTEGAPLDALERALSSLSVERTQDGGLRIDAPPEAAEPLAQLLESLARSLRGAEA